MFVAPAIASDEYQALGCVEGATKAVLEHNKWNTARLVVLGIRRIDGRDLTCRNYGSSLTTSARPGVSHAQLTEP
jgi:hypothetical protein